MLASATLQGKLETFAQELLHEPAAVGLQVPHPDGTHAADYAEVVNAVVPAPQFELPAGLQQLYMDVPTKLRLPTLLGAQHSA